MPRQVVGHERLDEIVTVVVAGVATQLQLLAGLCAGVREEVGSQLLNQEFVAQTLVNQYLIDARRLLHQVRGVVDEPCVAVRTEVAAECLAAPRYL